MHHSLLAAAMLAVSGDAVPLALERATDSHAGHRSRARPARGDRPPGGRARNRPCPCGSGRKFKRCCGGTR